MRIHLLICILLTCNVYSFAQSFDVQNFHLYTTNDGLSNNYVTGIEQDAYGYLWIATFKGLNRFDGSNFQKFFSDSSRNSLPQDYILKLKWLDKERLAVATLSGLHVINTRTLNEYNLMIPRDSLKSIYPLNRVYDATSDKKGNIFLTTSTGFYHFNSTNQLIFRHDHFSNNHLDTRPAAFGFNIIKMNDNALLVSTLNGVYLYNIEKKDFHAVSNKDDVFYQKIAASKNLLMEVKWKGEINGTLAGNGTSFFLFNQKQKKEYAFNGTPATIEKFDGSVGAATLQLSDSTLAINDKYKGFHIIHYNKRTDSYTMQPESFFDGYVCTTFFVDRSNRLWIGTNKGLLREKKSGGKVEQIHLSGNSLERDVLTLSVANNKIFAGTVDKLSVYNTNNLKELKTLDFSNYGPYANSIFCSYLIDKDTLLTGASGIWVDTRNLNHGKFRLNADASFDATDLIFKDSRGTVYVKAAMKNILYYKEPGKGYILFDEGQALSKLQTVKRVGEDREGNIWFAGKGIMRYNRQLKTFDRFIDSFPSIKIQNKWISSNIVFDDTRKMFFGVAGNGLVIYDLQTEKFSHITRNDGLPDNTVLSICLHDRTVWLGTEGGLASYNLDSKTVFSFANADGIPADPYAMYLLFYDSVQQKLYGALRDVVYRFNPDSFSKNLSPPEFFIESLVVNGTDFLYHPDNEIELSSKQNNIIVNLGTINFEDANQQQFAYRLVQKGNEQWQLTGTQRSIIFSNLSPGKHRLQVEVFTRNKSWPEQVKEITIVIHPPFWRTAWFLAMIVCLSLAVIYFIFRFRVKSIKRKANIDRLLVEYELKALHSQMNPHFIFNCLNSIREMILNNENKEASHYLSKFAQLIRITLDNSTRPFTSLKNTIDYLQRYLEMEAIRKAHLTYAFEIDESLEPQHIFLPPMLIQPFIENAIWHGQQPDKPMHLDIRFRNKNNNELVCIIEDDGIGIEASLKNKEQIHHNSVGIVNIRQRIQLLNEKYHLKSTVNIEDNSLHPSKNKTGTKVTLHLPIKITSL